MSTLDYWKPSDLNFSRISKKFNYSKTPLSECLETRGELFSKNNENDELFNVFPMVKNP